MADEEHLAILRQGVAVWNRWRKKNLDVRPDLSDAHLSSTDLNRANLSEANLRGANLSEANLRGADLTEANLSLADLSRAGLREASLSGATLFKADLSYANLSEANLSGTDLSRAGLSRAGLSYANLRGVNLFGANLSRADLSRADLFGADLREASLSEATLFKADLRGADLSRADLSVAKLSVANLSVAKLFGADLSRANLSEANLSMADLSEAGLSEADLSGAVIHGTIFGNNDLSEVTGLDTVLHQGPSTIGIDTLYRSKGKIPEVFLRGCGVPDALIEYLPSLLGAMQPIQFYSCFISYSTKDEDFARRLYSRMRDERLRVWFAPEDMEGGKKLHEQIERAIQYHDRLLLILSENSIESEWVQTEIYNARQVELKENRRKLFPIRLVDMDTIKAWKCFDADTGKDLAREVREYFIPDFTHWKDHDSFERVFAKLLDALKAVDTPPVPRNEPPRLSKQGSSGDRHQTIINIVSGNTFGQGNIVTGGEFGGPVVGGIGDGATDSTDDQDETGAL